MEKKIKEKNPSSQKKGMSNFVKYPLVLGLVGLVCGGGVIGIHYLTKAPIQASKVKAQLSTGYELLDGLLDTSKGNGGLDTEASDIGVIPAASVNNISVVAKAYLNEEGLKKYPNQDVFYYSLTTDKAYSGVVNFGVVIAGNRDEKTGKLVAYKYIANGSTEDGIGKNAANKGEVGPDNTITSGASAGVTLPAMNSTIKLALNHFNKEIVYEVGYVGNDTKGREMYYVENGMSGFAKFRALVSIQNEVIYDVQILEQGLTWTDQWSAKFNEIYKNPNGVSFDLLKNDFSKDGMFVTSATMMHQGYYTLLQKAIELYNQHHSTKTLSLNPNGFYGGIW